MLFKFLPPFDKNDRLLFHSLFYYFLMTSTGGNFTYPRENKFTLLFRPEDCQGGTEEEEAKKIYREILEVGVVVVYQCINGNVKGPLVRFHIFC